MYRAIDGPEPRTSVIEVLAGLAALGLFLALAYALVRLPAAPSPLVAQVAGNLGDTGLQNAVNAVLLNFRAVDTLLEKAVLILALTGIWALAPEGAWHAPAGNFLTTHAVEPPLRVLLKVLVPLVVITAIYLLFLGADEPGGAFQSGTIIAAIAILLTLGRILQPPRQTMPAVRLACVIGFLAFALTGFAVLALGRDYLDFPPAAAKPITLVVEVLLTISIAVTLFLLASGLSRDNEDRRP